MALGLAKLPFRSFAMNAAWMQLVLAAQDILAYAKELTSYRRSRQGQAADAALPAACTRPDGWRARAGAPACASPATGPGRPDLAAACARLDALPIPAG